MERGNIREYLREYPDIPKLPMLRRIAGGLEYLHSQNVIHGDIRGVSMSAIRAATLC